MVIFKAKFPRFLVISESFIIRIIVHKVSVHFDSKLTVTTGMSGVMDHKFSQVSLVKLSFSVFSECEVDSRHQVLQRNKPAKLEDTLIHVLSKKKNILVMHVSILPVTIPPPGIPPGICNFFLTWRSIPHPRARRKRQFPTPGTPHRPQIRCFLAKLDVLART